MNGKEGNGIIEMLAAKEMKMPTKYIMTRAEAIALLQKHMPIYNAADSIDFYIAAGMLEIKEEVKPIAFAEAINRKLQEKGINISVNIISNILDIMEKMKNNS